MERTKTVAMTEGPFLKKIILFALPLAAASMLQLLFNAADIIVVGQYAGSNALAAVGSTSSLVNLLVNMFVGLSVGSNVVAARFFGAQDDSGVSDTVHTTIFISLAGGFFMAAVGFLAARPLLQMMSSPADVIDLATLYLRIYFLGMPVTMLYNYGAALLRSVGDTRRPLICLAISGVLNVVLNLFFVIQFHMSVAGVALATIISQALSAFMVVRILMKETGPLHLDWKKVRPQPQVMRQILQVGIPSGLQGTVFSIANVAIQSSINSFGSIIIAGNSAASNIEGFIYMAMNACYQAAITFTSQNIGARRYQNLNRVLLTCQGCVIVIGLAMGLCSYAFGETLLGLYSNDPLVIEAGLNRLSVVGACYFLCGCMDVMVGSLRGMGCSVMPMIVSLLGSCALRLVYISTIFKWFRSQQILYYCYPITWIITLTAHIVCYIVVYRKITRNQK